MGPYLLFLQQASLRFPNVWNLRVTRTILTAARRVKHGGTMRSEGEWKNVDDRGWLGIKVAPATALCSLPPSGCVFPTLSPPARPSPWGEITLLPAIRPRWRSRSSTNQPWACGQPFVSNIQPLQAQLVLVSTGAYSAETLNTTVPSWTPCSALYW